MRVIDRDVNQEPRLSLPRLPICRLVGHESGPIPVTRFTGDGKYCLTAGNDRTVRLWNPSRLDPAYPPKGRSGFGDDDDEDGNNVGRDISVSLLPRALPIQVYEDGIRYTPTALAVTEDSTRLFVASDKTAVLIDSVTTKVLRQFHGHVAVINSVDVVNMDVLVTASYDATVCLWDGRSSNNRPIQTLKDAKDSVTSVTLAPNSIRTASVDGCVRTYDVRKGVLQCDNYHSAITGVAQSARQINNIDTSLIAVTCLDGAIRVQRDDEAAILPVPLICRSVHTAGHYALECALSSDGSFVVSGSEDGRAVLYDTSTASKPMRHLGRPAEANVLQELVGHTAPTCSVATHPVPVHCNVIITASYDGTCVVWANSRDFMR